MRQRFLREIKLARRVTHKNVCRIHDYGEDGGRSYISMQFVDGVELKTLARQSPRLSAEEACDIAIQLAEGLQSIHDAGIVHRDFKSANVMVDGHGDPRLMDFGIAKLWESKTPGDVTTRGLITGTPEYMSPEQATGEPLDPRSDLYAMGIMLFELFTGTRPFTGENVASVLYKQVYDPPPLESDVAAAIPAAIKPIIQRALAKRRDDRFSTATELRAALVEARAALATTVSDTTVAILARVQAVRASTDARDQETLPSPPPRPTPSPTPIDRPGKGRRRLMYWLMAAAGLVVVGAIAAVLGASSLFAPRPPETAPRPSPTSPRSTTITPATNTPATKPASEQKPVAADQSTPQTDCERGVATACTQVGLLYNRGGPGLPRDVGTAALYYERGCNGGDLAGCNNLGTLYQFGVLGLQGDRAKAAALYERACNGGHLDACANLGALYNDDRDATPAQRTRARDLLQKACAAGITRACAKLTP
jgi:serine/threonine-protein kinase